MAWCVSKHSMLDSTTVDSYMTGISAFHSYVISISGARASNLQHPNEARAVSTLLEFVKKHHKLASRAKRPLTWAEVKGIVSKGFDTHTCRGLHSRLLWMLCTLGMLRRGACTRLRISYEVRTDPDGSRKIIYHKNSDIKVKIDWKLRVRYIYFRVDVDKNVDSRRAAWGVIPEEIPSLGLRPVEIMEEYLLRVRPPSQHTFAEPALPKPRGAKKPKGVDPDDGLIDGLLLAFPNFKVPENRKRRTFGGVPYTNPSQAFKDIYERAFPHAAASALLSIGSHSGRKTLAEFLWANSNHDVRVVADFGNWKLDRGAVDRYFETPIYERLMVLMRLEDPFRLAWGG